jgi:hexosaminidase
VKRSIAIILLCLSIASLSLAQELPVLPKPVIAEQDKPGVSFGISQVQYSGADAGIQQRLNWHINRLPRPKTGGKILRMILLKEQSAQQSSDSFSKAWKDSIGKEGYILIANDKQYELIAHTETGLFYGMQTIAQLQRAGWNKGVRIADWPSFPHRQLYDDISRGPISTVAYVKEQIERLASLKINYLSFYIEHVVQPRSHPDFAPTDGKFTIGQIKELSTYAEKFHMQLVGSFQSFGHFEKILSLPQYQSMGETSTMISPLDPTARKFLADVIGELCDAFSAPYFNVNCDETFDLGKGRSKKYTDSIGVTRFYADHIKFLYDVVKSHKKQLMMWGDIALEHEEMLDILPKDIIYLTWEYGSQASFDKWIKPFASRKLRFMACPGILNSYRMFPDVVMASKNIEGFMAAARQAGAEGVITTVWDDGGAYLFSGDWYGTYKAAENSWNVAGANKTSFDKRYAVTAYGKDGEYYVQALDSLMLLRSIPISFNLNDNLWHADILPKKGRKLVLNKAGVDEVFRIVQHARDILQKGKPAMHLSDFNALSLAIDQYVLMMQARKTMPEVALLYERGASANNAVDLQRAKQMVLGLKDGYVTLRDRFKPYWLRENQTYSLDIAVQPYQEKIAGLSLLADEIGKQLGQLQQSLPVADKTAVGLNITANTYTYFQNWLMCGPFTAEQGKAPAFLYGGDGAEKAPKPGDLISYKGKTYRWQKYASRSGGVTNVDDFYTKATGGIAYVFCTVTTDKPLQAGSYAALPAGSELFCNGQKYHHTASNGEPAGEEAFISLPLKAGVNNLLFKIPGEAAKWSFSFRLAPGLTVTSQKQKYFINTEKGNHEAE